MRFDEQIAALRRIPVFLSTQVGDVPITGEVPAIGDLQVSLSGGAWTNAAGVWHEVGGGHYYYEAARSETLTSSFVAVRVAVPGEAGALLAVDVGDRIAAPETAAVALRIPIFLFEVDGTPTPGQTPSGTDVLVSLNGAPFQPAAGVVVEIGEGAYFLTLSAAEIVEGYGVIEISGTDAEPFRNTWSVRPASAPAAVGPAPIPASPSIGAQIVPIDHTAAALARLPGQYRREVP